VAKVSEAKENKNNWVRQLLFIGSFIQGQSFPLQGESSGLARNVQVSSPQEDECTGIVLY